MKMSDSKTKRAPRAKKIEQDSDVAKPIQAAHEPDVKPKKARAKKSVQDALPEVIKPVDDAVCEIAPEAEAEVKVDADVVAEADVESSDKKKKVGKKIKKQQLVIQLTDSLEKLSETMKKDLGSGKFDKVGEKLLKRYLKEVDHIATMSGKVQKKPSAEPRVTRSGFSKPYAVTDSMAEFAGWDFGSLKSRIEINNYLCAYIKSNDLQSSDDKRVIVPDEKLAKLLDYNEDQHGALNYAAMQKFISHLLVKN